MPSLGYRTPSGKLGDAFIRKELIDMGFEIQMVENLLLYETVEDTN